MEVRKTKSGWVVAVTNTCYGMLEQGGIIGREDLYKTETLERLGLRYDSDPAARDLTPIATNLEMLLHHCSPNRVLKAGHKIQ